MVLPDILRNDRISHQVTSDVLRDGNEALRWIQGCGFEPHGSYSCEQIAFMWVQFFSFFLGTKPFSIGHFNLY